MDGDYSIFITLASLSNSLSKLGCHEESKSVIQILNDLLKQEQDINDVDILANTVGLQGDVKPEYMGQGFALEPFFSDTSPV